ncbi:hypothetical protein F4810DRAFT_720323 [Camillea tinctor]|nr:hypothetical protein F4810DRAFT_720323 [Camillea tinctor]
MFQPVEIRGAPPRTKDEMKREPRSIPRSTTTEVHSHHQMDHLFPQHISAARVAAFVSTAAWIQGTSVSAVSLPADALDHFLSRHSLSSRQAPAPGADEEEEEDSVSEESDDDDPSSADNSSLSDAEDGEDGTNNLTGAQGQSANVAGQPAIQSSSAPRLSPGAQAAIGIWVAVAVLAIGALVFFVYRRRRRARELQEIRSLRDMESASYQASIAEKSGFHPPPPPGMEPVHYRESRAPSGQWMATPPWQEEPPTWRESRPWRQSAAQSVAPNGLPLNRGVNGLGGMPPARAEFDRRTEVTAETESTIFAYR